MKVLWFTNNPSNATKKISPHVVSGGWMYSLENKLKRKTNIELGVVFHWSGDYLEEFNFENTRYFPVNIGQKNKFKKYRERFFPDHDDNKLVDKYLDIIKTFQPDIIHIFGTENAFGLVSKYINIPCIVWIQGNRTVYTHKLFAGLSIVDLVKYTKIKHYLLGESFLLSSKKIKTKVKREKEIFKNIPYIIGRTEWDKRIASILAPQAEYFHVDDMLRNEFYDRVWDKSLGEKITILTTIAPNLYKGLETVMETAKLLKILGINFTWNIVGISGREQVCEIIRKKYKTSFNDLNISLLGKKKAEKLAEELSKSSIFVHPSHIDNAPNSVAEAMLMGLPVIATFTGGTGSLLTDKKEGVLIQDGDPWSMAGAITELHNNREEAIQMGKNARHRALKRHEPERIVNDLMDTYNQIIEKAKNEKTD